MPGIELKLPVSEAATAFSASSPPGGCLPNTPPITGRKIIATTVEAVSTAIRVIGKYCMNLPGMPGQNSIGRKAQSVVRVELTTGQNIRLAAST